MMNMEGKRELSVVIDGKVYRLSGGSDSYLQKLAFYVDGKISELKTQAGYNKLSTEYRDILLALTIAEEVFKLKEEIEVFNQDSRDREQELYELKQEVVDKKLQIDTANKLVEDYKTKVNELQKRMIGLETNHEFR
ncbi:cell division protein ZapA [Anaerobutyricum soehngenii]|uniref:cell division protein ZapA n=1 Tax=Anaerobutyricum soehngenii TaxID=105843 RepID=UPI003A8C7927